MKSKNKTNKNTIKAYENANKNLDRCLDQMANAYSTYDCTGLIPSKPENEAELDSYKEVYNYLPTDADTL
ncbi:MAG: hypothetical protein EGR46_05160 [Ruminococcus sp.]|uniref:hypothetical protein n=1 Tax=Ruminococcus sp. TaxID=41978 RepID=UPI0025F29294|nr:hypothetical protein [Ruminococcus sp.]MBD9048313.1 hypothetical protein [Ruminococcus sp.]